MIIADTNVVSELMKVEPSPTVRTWALAQGHHELRITAITVAEILYGIERLSIGRRKDTLREAERELGEGERAARADAVSHLAVATQTAALDRKSVV